MCGSRNRDEQFSYARGSWLPADILESNEQNAAGEEGKTNHDQFVLGLLAYIIGLGTATLPTLHKLDFLPKSHSISLFVETSNDSPTWEKG